MEYLKLVIDSKINNRDEVLEKLYSNDIFIFEENSSEIIEELEQDEKSWDFVDESIFGDTEKFIIKVYFNIDEKDKAKHLIEQFKNLNIKVNLYTETDEDWANNWKKYYHPIEIGDKIAIKPSWEEYKNKDRVVIDIDPGMAFGTGTHETTYLCLEYIEKYVKKDFRVFDIGCGSGILAIASAKLGAGNILAVDIDENAIKASMENIKLNKVEDKIKVYKGNLLDLIKEKADLIVSNIIAEIIVEMIPDLKNHLNNKGIFISSGIIVEKLSLVKNSLIEHGFEIVDTQEKNGWALIVGKLNV